MALHVYEAFYNFAGFYKTQTHTRTGYLRECLLKEMTVTVVCRIQQKPCETLLAIFMNLGVKNRSHLFSEGTNLMLPCLRTSHCDVLSG